MKRHSPSDAHLARMAPVAEGLAGARFRGGPP
jgi:hypothetical protein